MTKITKHNAATGEIITRDMTAEEQAKFDARQVSQFDTAMKNLRNKRNNLLKNTDHHALSDQTLSDDMRTYRKDLRDITEGLTTVEQVESVTWPTKPGA